MASEAGEAKDELPHSEVQEGMQLHEEGVLPPMDPLPDQNHSNPAGNPWKLIQNPTYGDYYWNNATGETSANKPYDNPPLTIQTASTKSEEDPEHEALCGFNFWQDAILDPSTHYTYPEDAMATPLPSSPGPQEEASFLFTVNKENFQFFDHTGMGEAPVSASIDDEGEASGNGGGGQRYRHHNYHCQGMQADRLPDDDFWLVSDTVYAATLRNYEDFRKSCLEGKDESIDRAPNDEVGAAAIIPAIELPNPIDPYVIRPWVRVPDSNFGAYFYNAETGESTWDEPEPLWKKKLSHLARLTPRKVTIIERRERKKPLQQLHIDFDEWRYRESQEEERERLLQEGIRQVAREEEATRRITEPNEREQIEYLLKNMVQSIEDNLKKAKLIAEHKERKAQRLHWHPASLGYRMKSLPIGAQSELVEGGRFNPKPLVSDLGLPPVRITAAGYVFPIDNGPKRPRSKTVRRRRTSAMMSSSGETTARAPSAESQATNKAPTKSIVEQAVMIKLYLACKVPPFLVKKPPLKEGDPKFVDKARDRFLKLLQRDIATALETSEAYVCIEEITPIPHVPKRTKGANVSSPKASSFLPSSTLQAKSGDNASEFDGRATFNGGNREEFSNTARMLLTSGRSVEPGSPGGDISRSARAPIRKSMQMKLEEVRAGLAKQLATTQRGILRKVRSKKALVKPDGGDVHINLDDRNQINLRRITHGLTHALRKPQKDQETGERQDQVPVNIKHPYTIKIMILPESQAFVDKKEAAAQEANEKIDLQALERLQPRNAIQLAKELAQQANDPFSPLRSGLVTHTTFRISWTSLAAGERTFETWESFWCSLISPVFYGYSTQAKLQYDGSKGTKSRTKQAQNEVDLYMDPIARLQLYEDELNAMMKQGMDHCNLTKEQYRATVRYKKALRFLEDADKRAARRESNRSHRLRMAMLLKQMRNNRCKFGPDPEIKAWQLRLADERTQQRAKVLADMALREEGRRSTIAERNAYSHVRQWLYNRISVKFPKLPYLLKRKLEKVISIEKHGGTQTRRKSQLFGMEFLMTKTKTGNSSKSTTRQLLQEQPPQSFEERLHEVFGRLIGNNQQEKSISKTAIIRRLTETQEEPNIFDQYKDLAALEALLFQPDYTQAFQEMDTKQSGHVDEMEFVHFTKATDYMLQYIDMMQKEVELYEQSRSQKRAWAKEQEAHLKERKRQAMQETENQDSETDGSLPHTLSAAAKRQQIKEELMRTRATLKVKRERLFAHHHTYIEIEGQPYCCLCREKGVRQNIIDLRAQEEDFRNQQWHLDMKEQLLTEKALIDQQVDQRFTPAAIMNFELLKEVSSALNDSVAMVEEKVKIRNEVGKSLFAVVDEVAVKQAAKTLNFKLTMEGANVFIDNSFESAGTIRAMPTKSQGSVEKMIGQAIGKEPMCVLGSDTDKRVKRVALNRNEIVCTSELSQGLQIWSDDCLVREKDRKLGDFAHEKEKEEMERRGMFQEELSLRFFIERILQKTERPYLLQQERTHRLFNSLLDQLPYIHISLKRLRWERTISKQTDNLTFEVIDPPNHQKYILRVINSIDPAAIDHIVEGCHDIMSLRDQTGFLQLRDVHKHCLFGFTPDGFTYSFHHCAIILMEHCDGGRLTDFIKTNDIDRGLMIHLVLQLVTALRSLHELGKVHRNISLHSFYISMPSASSLSSKLQARLGDYKFLKVLDNPARKPGDNYGAQQFLAAPEFNSLPSSSSPSSLSPTAKSDIWTFGFSLYRIMTGGNRPKMHALQRIPNELPVRFEGFSEVIRICLEPDPEKRATAAQVYDYLMLMKKTSK